MISVIVPVYNVESYLRKCLDSILAQTYQDLEILVIDDGSTDGSGKICDEYAEKDARIKVFHTKNRGLSAARNLGLNEAHGEWISFVDSDDWVEPDFCKEPLKTAIQYNTDLVIFRFRMVNGKKRIWRIEPDPKTKDATLRLIHEEATIVVWNKLFSRSLFDGVYFPEGKLYEDNAVTHRLIYKAERIYYSEAVLYNKVSREDNITSSMNLDKAEELCEMRMTRYKDLYNWGFLEEAEYVKQQAMFSYLKSVGKHGKYSQEYKAYLKNQERHISKYLHWKIKLMIYVLRLSQVLFDTICVLYGKRVTI